MSFQRMVAKLLKKEEKKEGKKVEDTLQKITYARIYNDIQEKVVQMFEAAKKANIKKQYPSELMSCIQDLNNLRQTLLQNIPCEFHKQVNSTLDTIIRNVHIIKNKYNRNEGFYRQLKDDAIKNINHLEEIYPMSSPKHKTSPQVSNEDEAQLTTDKLVAADLKQSPFFSYGNPDQQSQMQLAPNLLVAADSKSDLNEKLGHDPDVEDAEYDPDREKNLKALKEMLHNGSLGLGKRNGNGS